MCHEQEGWSNRPTWAVKLALDNDRDLYWFSRKIAADNYAHPDALADALQLLIENMTPGADGPLSDLRQFALDLVNFGEIAGDLINEYVNEMVTP